MKVTGIANDHDLALWLCAWWQAGEILAAGLIPAATLKNFEHYKTKLKRAKIGVTFVNAPKRRRHRQDDTRTECGVEIIPLSGLLLATL